MTVHVPTQDQAPSLIESEYSLLGALITRPDGLDEIAGLIEERHFFEPFHARIFGAIRGLFERGIAPSPGNLVAHLNGDPALEQLGPVYIQRLTDWGATVFEPKLYAQAVKDVAMRRLLMATGSEMISRASHLEPAESAAALAGEMQERLSEATLGLVRGSGFLTYGEASRKAIDAAELAFRSPRPLGLSTGMDALDAICGRLKPKDLIVIGAQTSMGKSACAQGILESAARECLDLGEGCAAFFSMEMTAEQLAARALARLTRIPADAIEDGRLSEPQLVQLIQAQEQLRDLPLIVDDQRGLTIAMIKARARRLKRTKGLKVMCVDHLQFIRPAVPGMKEIESTKEATSGLKELAGELEVTVILISHVSREYRARKNPRPILADLYGSSSIEQDADIVLMPFREENYLNTLKPAPDANPAEMEEWQEKMAAVKGKAEISMPKGRRRKTDIAHVLWDGPTTSFYEGRI